MKILFTYIISTFLFLPTSANPKMNKLVRMLDYQLRYLVEGASSNTDSVKNIPRSFSEAEGYKMVGLYYCTVSEVNLITWKLMFP